VQQLFKVMFGKAKIPFTMFTIYHAGMGIVTFALALCTPVATVA
jgi:hypothetical protein